MRAYRGRALLLALPLKSVVQRFAFAFLVGAALTVMILSRAEPTLVDNMRGAVSDGAAPILEFFSHPAASVASFVVVQSCLLPNQTSWFTPGYTYVGRLTPAEN